MHRRRSIFLLCMLLCAIRCTSLDNNVGGQLQQNQQHKSSELVDGYLQKHKDGLPFLSSHGDIEAIKHLVNQPIFVKTSEEDDPTIADEFEVTRELLNCALDAAKSIISKLDEEPDETTKKLFGVLMNRIFDIIEVTGILELNGDSFIAEAFDLLMDVVNFAIEQGPVTFEAFLSLALSYEDLRGSIMRQVIVSVLDMDLGMSRFVDMIEIVMFVRLNETLIDFVNDPQTEVEVKQNFSQLSDKHDDLYQRMSNENVMNFNMALSSTRNPEIISSLLKSQELMENSWYDRKFKALVHSDGITAFLGIIKHDPRNSDPQYKDFFIASTQDSENHLLYKAIFEHVIGGGAFEDSRFGLSCEYRLNRTGNVIDGEKFKEIFTKYAAHISPEWFMTALLNEIRWDYNGYEGFDMLFKIWPASNWYEETIEDVPFLEYLDSKLRAENHQYREAILKMAQRAIKNIKTEVLEEEEVKPSASRLIIIAGHTLVPFEYSSPYSLKLLDSKIPIARLPISGYVSFTAGMAVSGSSTEKKARAKRTATYTMIIVVLGFSLLGLSIYKMAAYDYLFEL